MAIPPRGYGDAESEDVSSEDPTQQSEPPLCDPNAMLQQWRDEVQANTEQQNAYALQVKDLNKSTDDLKKTNELLEQQIKSLTAQMKTLDGAVATYGKKLDEFNTSYEDLSKFQAQQHEATACYLHKDLADRIERLIREEDEKIEEYEEYVQYLQKQVRQRAEAVAGLEAQVKDLNAEYVRQQNYTAEVAAYFALQGNWKKQALDHAKESPPNYRSIYVLTTLMGTALADNPVISPDQYHDNLERAWCALANGQTALRNAQKELRESTAAYTAAAEALKAKKLARVSNLKQLAAQLPNEEAYPEMPGYTPVSTGKGPTATGHPAPGKPAPGYPGTAPRKPTPGPYPPRKPPGTAP